MNPIEEQIFRLAFVCKYSGSLCSESENETYELHYSDAMLIAIMFTKQDRLSPVTMAGFILHAYDYILSYFSQLLGQGVCPRNLFRAKPLAAESDERRL